MKPFHHFDTTFGPHNALLSSFHITWCFSDRASWIDYILITNLMHWLLFIHKILFSSICFEPQVSSSGGYSCGGMSWDITWCFSDRPSWIDYILITNLMHWLLFIHKILFSSTCFEPQVLIFRRIQLYTCSIWYCHSLWEFLVACRYTAWILTQPVYRQTTTNCDSTICCMYTTVSSWRWALEARNM